MQSTLAHRRSRDVVARLLYLVNLWVHTNRSGVYRARDVTEVNGVVRKAISF